MGDSYQERVIRSRKNPHCFSWHRCVMCSLLTPGGHAGPVQAVPGTALFCRTLADHDQFMELGPGVFLSLSHTSTFLLRAARLDCDTIMSKTPYTPVAPSAHSGGNLSVSGLSPYESTARVEAASTPGLEDKEKQLGGQSSDSDDAPHEVYPPRESPRFIRSLTGFMSRTKESMGTELQGFRRVGIPGVGHLTIRPPPWDVWLGFAATIVCFVILGLFAWNSTRSDNQNLLTLPSTESVSVVTSISNLASIMIGMLVGQALEAVRWRTAVGGMKLTSFLGMSSSTGYMGKFTLLKSLKVSWTTKVWILLTLFWALINYILSFILTVGLTPATIFNDNNWILTAVTGPGPWMPYDLSGIVFSSPPLGDLIALNYASFTSDLTQLFPITTNLSAFPGSHPLPVAPIRQLCDNACFAFLMPGTASGALPIGDSQAAPQFSFCNGASPEACITAPYVYDYNNLPQLTACDPSDRDCVAFAVLADRSSPNRSLFSTALRPTKLSGYVGSDSLRTHGPTYMVYFEPFTYDGPAEASNMTSCQFFMTPTRYAINACYKQHSDSSFAVAWSVCEPIQNGCNATDPSWQSSLNSSTVMSLEQRQAAIVHAIPSNQITGVEGLWPGTPVTINATQFFGVVASALNNTAALQSLVYNSAIYPDLSPFGADAVMRDLLAYTLAVGSSSISVDAPLDINATWSNIGQFGLASAVDRISIDDKSLYTYIALTAFTLVCCVIMFTYGATGTTPNTTDFPELNLATRAMKVSIFHGLSNADNGDVAEKLYSERIYVGQSDDGDSVAVSVNPLQPLQFHKHYN